ncbi:uncharacterized protein BX664DRAFT_284012 [Halteromyces radiatus]|uniref:uncharacterized protein n=1 Tax=Halteromyces radiatus TaxID=101107 RepID=UPI0022210B56|nr:uncharacterized protein BX664DRAFT_284012 [Halteromyces radiatus]KAI8085035.1 hypothetical protein BX664DRAFT_284012 [Halteromyces radiatus]
MAESQFMIHQATHMFMTEPIYFQIIQMQGAWLVWVGKQAGKMGDLAVSVPAFGSQAIPSATTVIGNDVKEFSRNLARRLALKYGEQFYVSLDVSSQDDMLNAFVEKKLNDLVKTTVA